MVAVYNEVQKYNLEQESLRFYSCLQHSNKNRKFG